MNIAATFSCVLLLFTSPLFAENRTLFSFSGPDDQSSWQTVNDGVMGGRSSGRFRISNDGELVFYGNLSLANNGGFASVRSGRGKLNLKPGDVISLMVKGDGRKYSLNLYPSRRRTAFSYRSEFQTKKNEWINVKVPISRFTATSFGRVLRGAALDPGNIDGIGILLGDKKQGPFQLSVKSISVESAG